MWKKFVWEWQMNRSEILTPRPSTPSKVRFGPVRLVCKIIVGVLDVLYSRWRSILICFHSLIPKLLRNNMDAGSVSFLFAFAEDLSLFTAAHMEWLFRAKRLGLLDPQMYKIPQCIELPSNVLKSTSSV